LERNRFLINGRTVFLRSKLDCCFFPLTGYHYNARFPANGICGFKSV